jgi:MipA family protein
MTRLTSVHRGLGFQMRASTLKKILLASACLSMPVCWAQADARLDGDVGLALYRTPPITRTADSSNIVLPYLYADYGALYARVDTFGYKIAPMGMGHLEIAARLSFEGYQPINAALDKRAAPRPIGLGTFQETPYGAFFLYALRDTTSGGNLLDLSYAAELDLGVVHVYPQAGVERRSAKYVQHLYGIDAVEATRSGLTPYSPGSSVTPNAAIAVEYRFEKNLKLTYQVRKRWLDKSISDSPLVDVKTQTTSFLALTRTFD